MTKGDHIEGWQAIADVFGLSEKAMRNRKDELVKAGAIIFLWKGSPPDRRYVVQAEPNKLWAWASDKAKKGESI